MIAEGNVQCHSRGKKKAMTGESPAYAALLLYVARSS
jgi:hypothetical protein